MNSSPFLLFSILFFVWLLIVTFLVFRIYMYFLKVSNNGKKESVIPLLKEVLEHEEANKKTLDGLVRAYDKINRDGLSHIQKIGLVRFNPFNDTGGDQSFILALVDAENTGVIVSSLHTRTGTRWYAKGVVKGKGAEYDLSADEEKALRGAKILSQVKS